jgi:hypothetical protein
MSTKTILLFVIPLFSSFAKAQISLPFIKNDTEITVTKNDYIIDTQNNIVVTKIIENLNGNQIDIYTLAKKYLTEAYEETKYKILNEDIENYTILAEGIYNNFASMNIFPNTYYLNAEFKAKIDSKNGRARISLFVNKYRGQRINGNDVKELSDNICDFQPINLMNNEKERLYNKAFPILIKRLKTTIAKIEEALKAGILSVQDDNW